MKNKKVIEGAFAIGIIFIISIFLCGCLDEKSKFIGTWQYSEGGFITFYDNNTVLIDNIGPLGDLQLIGIFNYSIANNQVTFTSGSISIILNYKFLDSSTLQLSNNAGLSITLIKI